MHGDGAAMQGHGHLSRIPLRAIVQILGIGRGGAIQPPAGADKLVGTRSKSSANHPQLCI
jgi:hypothetical protein